MWISPAAAVFLFSLSSPSRFSLPSSLPLSSTTPGSSQPANSLNLLASPRSRSTVEQSSSYPTPTRSTSAACATAAIYYGLGISL